MVAKALLLLAAQAAQARDACLQKLDAWCSAAKDCPLAAPGGDPHSPLPHCAVGQKMFALRGVGGLPNQESLQWRCYAANNTDSTHEHYTSGRCYCTRDKELKEQLCKCDPSKCVPTPAPPSPPPPLPFANSTYVVFNSSISPANSRAPVTCYRIPMIAQVSGGTKTYTRTPTPKTGFLCSCDTKQHETH